MEKYLQYQLKAIILLNFQKEGRLAQLVRAFALHAKCRGFESLIAHQFYPENTLILTIYYHFGFQSLNFVLY